MPLSEMNLHIKIIPEEFDDSANTETLAKHSADRWVEPSANDFTSTVLKIMDDWSDEE